MTSPNQGNTFARLSGSGRITHMKENIMIAQDDTSTEVKDKSEKTKAEKGCLYCLGNHWLNECSVFYNLCP